MQHSCSHHSAFCSMTWLTRMHLRTWQRQMTPIMQPFQCDLRPQVQGTHRTRHTGTTTRCRTQRRNRLTSKQSKPQPPHTRGTFHHRLQPFYTEKCKVSCSGFLPKREPRQHSCSHYNAFCSISFITTSLRHHFPSSALPFITTFLRHRFPQSPLPFITTFLRLRFPQSPLPFVTTSLRHHFPSSPLPFVTTLYLAFYSCVTYCY